MTQLENISAVIDSIFSEAMDNQELILKESAVGDSGLASTRNVPGYWLTIGVMQACSKIKEAIAEISGNEARPS